MNIKIGLASSLVLLGMLACRAILPAPAPSPTPRPAARVEELQFKDAETGQRFRALDGCITNIVDNSWRTNSYRLLGNFFQSNWCRGAGARADCQVVYSTVDNRDQHVIELNTLLYDYPQVFGLGLHSHWIPKSTGWGASFYFAEKGASIVGEGWSVTFRQYVTPSGPARAAIPLGSKYGYTIFGPQRTEFEYPAEFPLREDLAVYLASPQAMRDRGLAHILALAEKVYAAINAHQVNTCDPGPYEGKGIPPACAPRPLTPGEEAEELARAKAYFTEQEQLLRDYYQEMYAAWMLSFPLDQCWP